MHSNRRRATIAPEAVLLALVVLGSSSSAADLTIDGRTSVHRAIGTRVVNRIGGTLPNSIVLLGADQDAGPVNLFGDLLPLGLSPAYALMAVGTSDAAGVFEYEVQIPVEPTLVGERWFVAGVVIESADFDITNSAQLTVAPDRSRAHTELAGEPLAERPFFHNVRTHNAGGSVHIAVDPALFPEVRGRTVQVHVVAARSAAEWDADSTLVDVTSGGSTPVTFTETGVQANTFEIDAGTLASLAPDAVGIGYDVVLDFDGDGLLSAGDIIDGYDDRAGFYVVHDVTQPGPHAVVEEIYSLGSFLGQDLYYPADIASLGSVPLIVVSHGNGHDYRWYDHVGHHLASYGYVVMSHQNNTVPGVQTASLTTLTNTDAFLGNLTTIAGGALAGHIDSSRIVWLGHSRGGEGVVRALDRLFDGSYTAANFTLADIVLASSIAPTDFLGTNVSTPHGTNYHLWVGGSDSDVTGCADSDVVQSFHLLDRAEGQRQAISLHGVGHGNFHAGGGLAFATGPCRIGASATHAIMRGYLLPLVEYHTKGNPATKDFLHRQWESFRPIGAPVVGECVVVNLQFTEGGASGKLVIDDYQSNDAVDLASSGSVVSHDMPDVREDRLDDGNLNFTSGPNAGFNGFTGGSATDTTRGALLTADGTTDFHYSFALDPGVSDWTGHEVLSFRSCQVARHPLTLAEAGDLTFEVRVTDAAGIASTLSIGAFGGGIEEPYARTSCGSGVGWGNEFETIRLPLRAFRESLPELDLANMASVAFLVGPSHGSGTARLGFDDLELVHE